MADYRRANYIQLTSDRQRLEYLSAKYNNLRYLLRTVSQITVNEAYEANLFGIAYDVFDNVDLWYVIGFMNGILDPYQDIPPGTVLNIPALSDVTALLDTQEQQSTLPTVLI